MLPLAQHAAARLHHQHLACCQVLHAPKLWQRHSCLLQGLRTVIITDSEEWGTQHLQDATKHRELWLFLP